MTEQILTVLYATLLKIAVTLGVLLAADVREPVVVEDRCDYIENNHLLDRDSGNEYLHQQIFWDFDGRAYHVRAWRMVKDPAQRPERYRTGWRVRWHDGGTLRSFYAPHWVETFGPFDPEVEDRRDLPPEFRRALYEAKATGRVVEVIP